MIADQGGVITINGGIVQAYSKNGAGIGAGYNADGGTVHINNGLDEMLYKRREHYPAEVPPGVLVLTMGMDTQDNRLEYEVVGWDRNEQSWGISRGIIPGRLLISDSSESHIAAGHRTCHKAGNIAALLISCYQHRYAGFA